VAAIAAIAAAACVAAVWLGRSLGAPDSVVPAVPAPSAGAKEAAVGSASLPLAASVDRAGRAAFEIGAGTALRCDGPARVEAAAADARGARFELVAGRVVAEVGAVEPGFRFVVATPGAEVEARGTVFSVEVADDGAAAVVVSAGSVEVRRLREGETLVVSAGQELRPGDLAPRTAAVGAATRDLAVALELCSSDLPLAAPEEDRLALRIAELPGAAPAEVAAQADALVAAIAGARGRTARGADASAASLLELAQAYRRASLFADAALAYERLVSEHRTSEIGLSGLVALGQLESLVLGRTDAARSHFAAYLAAAPRGPLAGAARQGLATSAAE
jgi:hypothetical protein